MKLLNPNIKKVTTFAPATCANVAVGFDILGFACDILGDTLTLTLRDDKQIMIDSIDFAEAYRDHYSNQIPFEIDKNTAAVVVKHFCETFNLDRGFTLEIKKGIPLSSGLGGSAASAAAAAVACNAFLEIPLSKQELVQYALLGEVVASGSMHADNVAPCVYGGVTLVHSLDPLKIISLPVPDIFCVLVHPHLSVNTKDARNILKENILLRDHIKQSAQLASFIVALYEKNNQLLKASLTDFLIESQRSTFVPAFYALKDLALKNGALGMSFSGSGPTMFAFSETESDAKKIAFAMSECLKHENIATDMWVSKISVNGARVLAIN